MRRLLFVVLALVGSHVALAQNLAPEVASGWTTKKPVTARRDMVAAANPLAVAAGEQMLRHGGSAVDATVAVQMVLNLVESQSSGIGGGAFMLVHDARSGLLTAYDGRATAPFAARPTSGLKAIVRTRNGWIGGADPRREGTVAGH